MFRRTILCLSLAALATLAASPAPAQELGEKFMPIEIKGTLAQTDAKDRKLTNSPCKIHSVNLAEDKTYVIEMTKQEGDLDPYLRLEDADGNQLAEDDDSGGNLNARILFTARKTAAYQIFVTSFNSEVGAYQLKVNERTVKAYRTGKALAVDKNGIKIDGQLANSDPIDDVRPAKNYKVYSIQVEKDKTYVIDLESEAFDAWLRLLDSKFRQLAEDDDSGGNLNSRIEFRAEADGVHHIIATTLNGNVGAFTLRVARKGD